MRRIITTAIVACSAALAPAAHAAWQWRVQTSYGTPVCAKAAAGDMILSCEKATNGYRVKTWVRNNAWAYEGNAVGISLTKGNGNYWLVGEDHSVWVRLNGAWYSFAVNRCENGTPIRIRQAAGDHTLAVGYHSIWGEQLYVAEAGGSPTNTVRWWNGSCWQRLPLLPSGSVREVAIFDDYYTSDDGLPWVVTLTGTIYRWDGNQWVLLPNGTGNGVGGHLRKIIGSDNTSIWNYIQSTDSFSLDTSWTYGQIVQLGTYGDSAWDVRSVVAADGKLYW